MYSFSTHKLKIERDWTDLKFEKISGLLGRIEKMVNINLISLNNENAQVDMLQERFNSRVSNIE